MPTGILKRPLAAAVVMAAKAAPKLWAQHQAAADAWKAEQSAIAARADQQQAWVLAGDDRGVVSEMARRYGGHR